LLVCGARHLVGLVVVSALPVERSAVGGAEPAWAGRREEVYWRPARSPPAEVFANAGAGPWALTLKTRKAAANLTSTKIRCAVRSRNDKKR
jgi:hypothetical protein